MKKLLMPVMALLLIIQSSYLLAAADGDDYFKQAKIAAHNLRWPDLYDLIDKGKVGVNELRGDKSDVPFIDRAVACKDKEAIKELLKRGADLNMETYLTPLQSASNDYLSTGNNVSIIQLLLDNGADPHAKNNRGWSTLDSLKNWDPFSTSAATRKQELVDLFAPILPGGEHIKGSEE